MSEIELRTPLVAVPGLPYRGRDIEIVEVASQGHVNLRGAARNAVFKDAVQATAGVSLPLAANTASGTQPPCALWLGPDEWLLRLPGEAQAATCVDALDAALAGEFFAASDISSAQTVLRLSGAHARRVLSKGCTLDLHPGVFGAGRCAQTNMAQATVILLPLADAAGGIEVVVRRSFADYLARWLLDASR